MKKNLLEIEQNISLRKKTDRIMWFSMWIVLSLASFGIAWFPMIYYTIKRRNDHFLRQERLEKLILNKLGKKQNPEKMTITFNEARLLSSKNEKALTVSTILIFPAFFLFYSLKNDLQKHEEHQRNFLIETCELVRDSEIPLKIQSYQTSPKFPRGKYIVLSVVTFGLAAFYWLYRIFNDYNNHFKMQWIIEDELLCFLKRLDKQIS